MLLPPAAPNNGRREGGGATLSDTLEMTDETENILKAKARMEALNLGPLEGLWDAITEGFFHHIRPDVLTAIMFFSVVSAPPCREAAGARGAR